jgi:NADPH-dependent 2,4-dienoyl-CoA reductase/sulfur reductase-like enzyme
MTECYDVIVCGAGPAGIAAAAAAASTSTVGAGAGARARVAVIDANARAGGQIWRHDVRRDGAQTAGSATPAGSGTPAGCAARVSPALPAARAARRSRAAFGPAVTWYLESQVVAATAGELLVEGREGAERLRYRKLVLATGARELLLPFPGWTLPGVYGAGGLQSLVKQSWPIAGRRVVVAGSGPLLLATAALLRRHGAHVLGIHEQAPARRLRSFAWGLARWPRTAWAALALRSELAGVPYRCGEFVRAAVGDERLRAVDLETPGGVRRVDCDYLAIGYGLVPNVELADLLGCRLGTSPAGHARVVVDDQQRTSVANVFAAGEVCGIGGAAVASIEGRIAGLTASGALRAAAALLARRRRARRFAAHLGRAFPLDPRIHALAEPDTVICRCEDVPFGALAAFATRDGWDGRAAKLATRCGMGACQGRLCGAALVELGLAAPTAAAPPLFPTRLDSLTEPFATTSM